MFGKRESGSGELGTSSRSRGIPEQEASGDVGSVNIICVNSISRIPNDNRPYTEIQIGSDTLLGLLDSGAKASIAGGSFESIMKKLDIKPSGKIARIRTAVVQCTKCYDVPVTYCKKTERMSILFVASVSQQIILGMDFWIKFKIRPVMIGEIECQKTVPVSVEHKLNVSEVQELQSVLKRMPFSQEGFLSKEILHYPLSELRH